MINAASVAVAGSLVTAADSVAIGIAENAAAAWLALTATSGIAYTPMQKVKNFRSAQEARNLGWQVHSWWDGLAMSKDV